MAQRLCQRRAPDRSVLVFIHGFNNRFEDSVYRFAQIVHDSGAHSVPILVTWPSRGSALAYGYDRESTNYTRNALENAVSVSGARSRDQGGFDPRPFDGKLAGAGIAAPDGDPQRRSSAQVQERHARGARRRCRCVPVPDRRHGQRSTRNSRCSCRATTALWRVSRRVWGNVARLGSIDPEQAPYKEELADNNITVIDLTKVKAGDKLHHGKFAESPEIVQLIGTRMSDGQALTDNRIGLGDRIVAATAGAAAMAGTAAGLAIAAPVAVIDQNTRDNYANQMGELGVTAAGGRKTTGARKVSNDCGTKTPTPPGCNR